LVARKKLIALIDRSARIIEVFSQQNWSSFNYRDRCCGCHFIESLSNSNASWSRTDHYYIEMAQGRLA